VKKKLIKLLWLNLLNWKSQSQRIKNLKSNQTLTKSYFYFLENANKAMWAKH
jgi:hypothetical protein